MAYASDSALRLAQRLDFQSGHGFCDTALSGVTFVRADRYEPACPQVYDQGVVFILQGSKQGRANGQSFRTGPEQCLLLTNSYPIFCETFASEDEPLLGLYLELDLAEIRRQLDVLPACSQGHVDRMRSVVPCPLSSGLQLAVSQLVGALQTPESAEILGAGCLSRIWYELLHTCGGPVLRDLVNSDSKLARVSRAIRYIEAHLDQKLSIDTLAEYAGLSPSAFHRAFRQATSETPLQYIKQLRLNQARILMLYQGRSAQQAAFDVGYESSSQFHREFKRYFGVPPGQASELGYSRLQGVSL